MSALQQIQDRLRKHPDLKYEVEGDTLTVAAPTPEGFSVWLTEADSEWTVGFDGWHEHFKSEEDALNCFAFGLSDECRLKIHLRGSFPYRWTVEHLTLRGWEVDSTTGRLVFPFWRPQRVVYRQNRVLTGQGS